MREYCLVNKSGAVVNMSVSHKPPVESDYQIEQGLVWVPVSQVPYHKLTQYRYWNERP